jgi:hypothetical protein
MSPVKYEAASGARKVTSRKRQTGLALGTQRRQKRTSDRPRTPWPAAAHHIVRTGNITASSKSMSGDWCGASDSPLGQAAFIELATCERQFAGPAPFVTAILPRMILVVCLYTKPAEKVQQAITRFLEKTFSSPRADSRKFLCRKRFPAGGISWKRFDHKRLRPKEFRRNEKMKLPEMSRAAGAALVASGRYRTRTYDLNDVNVAL